MNGIDYFDRGWGLDPDKPCMIEAVTGRISTYAEVRRQTFRIANALRARGYGIGSKGAVLSHNNGDAITVFLSLLRLGMAPIPVSPRNAPQDNAWTLQAMDCEILFFQREFASIIPAIAMGAPGIREFVCIESIDHYSALDDLILDHTDEEFEIPHDLNRIYQILPTGGTTGRPKGVMLPNRSVESHVTNMLVLTPCKEPPVFLAAAPVTHAAGYILQTTFVQGGTAIIMPKVDFSLLLESIPKYRVSLTFLPPTVIYGLLEQPDIRKYDYASLRYFIYGASPMAPEKLRKAIEVFGPIFCQIYGQSETSFPNTFLSPADHLDNGAIASTERLLSCGRATPFCQVAIVRDGKKLADGEIGEIAIRGTSVMLGYYKDDAATAEVSSNGWHLTGDIGYRDKDGYFYIVDRKKDMIISGGFNIYSVEVEAVLLSHPAVQECAVIGIPDPKWGEMVAAEIELAPGYAITEVELITFCKERIGSMKTPKLIAFVTVLPRSPAGKVLKREVRKKYWDGASRMVN